MLILGIAFLRIVIFICSSKIEEEKSRVQALEETLERERDNVRQLKNMLDSERCRNKQLKKRESEELEVLLTPQALSLFNTFIVNTIFHLFIG